MATNPRKAAKAARRTTTTPAQREALAAEREAARKRQANKGTPDEQASISTTSDDNGAEKGYIGRDAADMADRGEATTVQAPGLAAAASYREPVPPGGHPSDPTSYTSVGAAAEDEAALAKGDAARIGGAPEGDEGDTPNDNDPPAS